MTKEDHHHHKAYYESENGYVYSQEELEALKVPHRIRVSKCVNLFVPMQLCVKNLSFFERQFKDTVNNCSKLNEEFYQCQQQHMEIQQATHVNRAFYANQELARAQGISNTMNSNFYKSPLAFTF